MVKMTYMIRLPEGESALLPEGGQLVGSFKGDRQVGTFRPSSGGHDDPVLRESSVNQRDGS